MQPSHKECVNDIVFNRDLIYQSSTLEGIHLGSYVGGRKKQPDFCLKVSTKQKIKTTECLAKFRPKGMVYIFSYPICKWLFIGKMYLKKYLKILV